MPRSISRVTTRWRRLMWFARNFRAFDAPVLMLVHTPRYMGPPQWSDIGMWLQTVALLLREEGLDCCLQEAWAIYTLQIRECLTFRRSYLFLRHGHRLGRPRGAGEQLSPCQAAPLEEAVSWEGF
jgi:hypothetical protein